MGPSRKRPRTKPPKVEEPTSPTVAAKGSIKPAEAPRGNVDTNESNVTPVAAGEDVDSPLKSVMPDASSPKQIKSKASWYGTWPRKSSASTQIARETILADKPKNTPSSSDLSRFESSRKSSTVSRGRPPSMYLGKSRETSDVTMGGTTEADLSLDKTNKADIPVAKMDKTDKSNNIVTENTKADITKKMDDKPTKGPPTPNVETAPRPVISSGWLGGWLGRPTIPVEGSTTSKPSSDPQSGSQNDTTESSVATTIVCEEPPKEATVSATSTSWFGLWSTAAPSAVSPEAPEHQMPVKPSENDVDTIMKDAPPVSSNTELPPRVAPAVGSSWAFWSATDTTKVQSSKKSTAPPVKDQGELAIEGEPSETRPEPAQTVKVRDDKPSKPSKRGRPVSVEETDLAKNSLQLEPPSTKGTPSQSPAHGKTTLPNLLMPSVRGTYNLVENPSILQQITQLLLRGHQKPANHVFLVKETPKIKKALAIGIHGLFPAPLLRTVIGQPTGTSIRFANHASEAIRRWGDQNGCTSCEIEKVALEGEGKIAERVDNLWKLLLNWIDHIRKADFILIACHSQGVPVAIMLIAKLVEFGVVTTGKIGVCAMAGVSLGPFADYKSRLFSGSAGELFEFADPQSVVSQRYEHSLRIALKYGTRITFCGSIDDQLVSLESSIFSTASHPHIYRAVFVDGRIHAPNFLSHLIGFALKLRNLGVSDHGLIRELSAPLAGSLYTGEGHSRLYDEEKVYDLSIEYALETTSVGDVPLEIANYQIPTNANPYILPWIMRGLLEEDFVKTELDTEVAELLKQFDDWKPSTKVLKDVKYRLEAVRSKL